MTSPQDRRFRTAITFSVLTLVAVFIGSRAFDVPVGPEEYDRALAMAVPALVLSVMSVLASWQLVASLLEKRPVFRDPAARWLWIWTLVFCAALLVPGLLSSASQTVGQGLIYASGLLASFIGAVGLLVSVLPRSNRRATGR